MALRDINLIPSDFLHNRLMFRHLWLWAGCLLVILSLIWGYYIYQALVVLPQNRPVTTVADMQKHLGATIGEIQSTEQEIERLNLQEAFLKRFTKKQPLSGMLLELSQAINPQTWLTRFDIDKPRETDDGVVRSIRLYGYSFTNEELGEFLTRISNKAFFRQVVLKFAKETRISASDGEQKSRIKVIQFQIDGEILGS